MPNSLNPSLLSLHPILVHGLGIVILGFSVVSKVARGYVAIVTFLLYMYEGDM